MARNANMDKAKRQAVGIYRAASPQAFLNHGTTQHSGGDYRAPEGAKLFSRPDHEMLAAVSRFNGEVTLCEPAMNSSGRYVQPNFNRKRGGCDPRTRGELMPGKPSRAVGLLDRQIPWTCGR